MTDVLFVQGGGAGAHDGDAALVASLRRALGDGYVVHYPRMPDEADPQFAPWSAAILHELGSLDEGAVAVGHSIGGTILAHTVAEQRRRRPSRLVLVSAPFLGDGGWSPEGFTPADLGAGLNGIDVHVVHGLADDTVPPTHADLYVTALPQAKVIRLPGRGHQLDGDLTLVAAVIREGE